MTNLASTAAPLPAAKAFGPMRQTQVAAGSLALAGVVLGLTVSTWFLALSAIVGVGLLVAGTTGVCPMAVALSRAPWNKGLAAND